MIDVKHLSKSFGDHLVLDDISTGASNDIERATETARKMVTKYGMSDAADFTAQELYDAALSDKKIAGGSVSLVIPEKIGCCHVLTVSCGDMPGWLKDGGAR